MCVPVLSRVPGVALVLRCLRYACLPSASCVPCVPRVARVCRAPCVLCAIPASPFFVPGVSFVCPPSLPCPSYRACSPVFSVCVSPVCLVCSVCPSCRARLPRFLSLAVSPHLPSVPLCLLCVSPVFLPSIRSASRAFAFLFLLLPPFLPSRPFASHSFPTLTFPFLGYPSLPSLSFPSQIRGDLRRRASERRPHGS